MIKKEFLPKHCKTSKNGTISLTNTFVETAIKIHNCPVKVSCSDFEGQIATYSVTDLLTPIDKRGPYINKFEENSTYWIYVYPWKGVPVENYVSFEQKFNEVPEVVSLENKKSREYIIRKEIVKVEDIKVSFLQYVGLTLREHRKRKNLTQGELSNLTNGEVSTTSISQIESNSTNPVLSSIEALAIALDIHVSDLFPPKDQNYDESKN